MNCALLPPPSQLSRSIAEIAREAGLTWVTIRNTLQGGGTIALFDRVRHVLGCRWIWTASINPSQVGREFAARRKAKRISQRAMAARLGVSQQAVLALETRFTGRSRTLASYLRILSLHHALSQPGQHLIPPSNDTEADLIHTPGALARAIIAELRPHLSGELLDPARGPGAFHDAFPANLAWHCCEITEGRDFLAWDRRAD